MNEMTPLNFDSLDVEELEQRLELQADTGAAPCDCSWNDCGSYCNPPSPT